MAQDKTFGNMPPLHVDGKFLRDENGNKVVLHGVMDTPSTWFNGGRWGNSYDSAGETRCLAYFNKLFTALTDTTHGAFCNVFRLHLEPAWTNDNSYHYCDKTGDGEADIQHFNPNKLKTYIRGGIYWKLINAAIKHGLYVVIRPPGVCPGTVRVGDVYNNYLLQVWDIVTQYDSIRKYSGQISIELANEPVSLVNANGQDTKEAMHDFFQPIVNKIRQNGFTGIIWVPGTVWQQNYRNYATNPITGYNIGYAVHDYCGWYGTSDQSYDKNNAINQFHNSVPVVDTKPIIITEVDWSPEKPGTGHYNESGAWVASNWGTWATGSTSKWGSAYKATLDHFKNISMTLSSTGVYIDIDKSIATSPAKAVVAFDGEPEASGAACFKWYREYAQVDYPHGAYQRKWSADLGNGYYKNPILNGDFPDPDVIRVGDTYYMVSTTMYHFPGATILKSKDLVNWEYCANPLQQIDDNDAYNLLNGANHYSQGQWAASLNYSKGKFYLYFICYGRNGVDGTQNILLTTSNPSGKWTMKKMNDHYYDSGWLFDDDGDGYIYVACGIDNIWVNKLDRNLNKLESKQVLSIGNGLEGSHMYHIGDYYYIYATYGGTEGSQTIFRSKNPMGPYEEHEGRVFANQHIHQGALVQTQTGEWWTILFKDAGAIGRIPFLEPVKWVDDWPVIGNNGKDVTAGNKQYKKPNVVNADIKYTNINYGRTYLPTNDTFTDATLGMQWQWNHNPVADGWSLRESPGNLRLHTVTVTNTLYTARNSLTQRILGYSPEGTASTKVYNSYGTIRMDISHMQEGDVAGLSVFQDPYSVGAIKMINGKKVLYFYQSSSQDWTKLNNEQIGTVINSDIVYLRAIVNFGTNKCNYYYSLDNKKWTKFGGEMTMSYQLSLFVGQRFYLFNYATQSLGGYVDIDWFSTEPYYSETHFFSSEVLNTFKEADITMKDLSIATEEYAVTPNNQLPINITCTYASGDKVNVATSCTYEVEDPSVAGVIDGKIVGESEGTTNVVASFTDPMGNTRTVEFTVTVSYFPFTEGAFNPSISGTGTYVAKSRSMQTAANGFAGWSYSQGADFTKYPYLIVEFRIASVSKPVFKLFDKNSYGTDCYSCEMGKNRKVVIELKDLKKDNGKALNLSKIYMAGFTTDGSKAVLLKDVYFSLDGENPVDDIVDTFASSEVRQTEVYDINGRNVGEMKKGINIVRQTLANGKVVTKKVFIR